MFLKKQLLCSLIIPLCLLIYQKSVFASDTIFLVPFYPVNVDESLAEDFTLAVSKQKFAKIEIFFDDDEQTINPSDETKITSMYAKARAKEAKHVLCGSIERSYGEGYLIKSFLRSVHDEGKKYVTGYFIQNDSQLKEAAKIIVGRCVLHIKGTQIPKIGGVKIVEDEAKSTIAVKWEKNKSIETFAIYRSPIENGPFIKIAEVEKENEFIDVGVMRGIEYRYGIAPVINSIPCDPSHVAMSHLRIQLPKGMAIEEEKKKKTVTDKQIAKELKNETVQKHLAFLADYYIHPVKLNVALYMGRSYIEKGQVIALSDFESHEINKETKRIKLIGREKSYIVEMAAKTFFSFLDKAEEKKVPEISALIERLMKNAIAYAVPKGEEKMKDEYGHTVYVPYFEAIGLSTEYFKNYEKWENNTLMLSTSDSELKKRMKEVIQKGPK
jgi:hypothetical protein